MCDRISAPTLALVGLLFIDAAMLVAGEAQPLPFSRPPVAQTSPTHVIFPDQVPLEDIIPIPEGVPIQRHVIAPDGRVTAGGQPPSTVVYSNTRGTVLLPPGPGRLIADDLFMTAVGGCQMSSYEILVGGGGEGGDGTEGFSVEFALYDACPGTGGQPIPGTEREMTFNDDGLHLITVELPPGQEVLISASMWIGARFSRSGAGWVVGTEADIGFTDDVYDFPRPGLFCQALFGNPALYAGFYARIECAGAPATQFLGYLNNAPGPLVAPGANTTVLDDVELRVDDCVLSSYEVGLIGGAGPFTADLELWFDCRPDSAIPGTHGTFNGLGNGSIEIARVTPDPPVPLPAPVFWVAITPSNGSTGAIGSGEPILGTTQDLYAVWDDPSSPGSCSFFWFGGNPPAGFHITVFCEGAPPMGACCELPVPPGGAPCVETPEFACTQGRWVEGAACDPDPFDPPCGTSACCLPDDSCANMTEADCQKAGGSWQLGVFCGEGGQECPFFACGEGGGDCCSAHGTPGCDRADCCDTVCSEDAWCCEVEWDGFCADEARLLCTFSCPFGTIEWVDPPNGVVDARQPHAPTDPALVVGIDTITASGPLGAESACCWSLCETAHTGSPNRITGVDHDGAGTYTIHLQRPITPGAVTTIVYERSGSTATFIAHPGNVNGDGVTNAADILATIDCINGLDSCPWGLYGCDVDASGQCLPPDILRVIDLLNGAGSFTPWFDTPLPQNPGQCP